VIWDRAAECADRAALDQLQLERLRAVVARCAERVPFYRRALPARIRSGLQTIGDIVELPFTTKDDLREAYPFGMLAVERSELVRVHASSGTRGKPTLVATPGATSSYGPRCARGRSCRPAAVRDDVVHNAYGYGLFTGGLGFHYGAERMGAMVVPASRRQHAAPGAADRRSLGAHSLLHPVLRPAHRRPRSPARASTHVSRRWPTGSSVAEPWVDRDAR